jgi:hypothetical protein
MRAERIQSQIALLESEQHRLRGEAHRKIAAFAKEANEAVSDQAVEHFARADALVAESESKVAGVIELVDQRVALAAEADRLLGDLRSAIRALDAATAGIDFQVRGILRNRDGHLDPSRRGEKLAIVMTVITNPINEAVAQSVFPLLSGTGLADFNGLGDPARARTMAAAADVGAQLRQRLME